ncbi:3'(2'),5'-bisphosphate nucleotidase CysQ [Methylobrevis albus]|uniref:3'(2'),5'-bisphosphate nucleotidase CysQ n=1 Tax=Methylobrevis albus TaxID=2793297 RepID=A0A931I0B0_9HYPH|nr:3'(2'),5'-bisphosphate nucleotidase CysQ [Methylobrevis albus]MBH0236990.1 3'(2'),5'-bisphosphate nucleotidase CysQ [Methylobrevis albus]
MAAFDDDDFLAFLIETALAAGREIMAVYEAGEIAVAHKADASPVTLADERAEAVILAALAAYAPGVPVVAEEEVAAGRVPETAERFFLVDPLDGTREFIGRNGEFTVNIALIEAGTPVAGVVYAPALGSVFAGIARGDSRRAVRASVTGGTAGALEPIAVRACGEGVVAVGSRSHDTAETRTYLARYPVSDYRAAGSSLKFCLVAGGEADLYPRFGRTMEWDTAAGDAVLRAAGGKVVTVDGAPLAYGKRNQRGDCDFANPAFIAAGPLALVTHDDTVS